MNLQLTGLDRIIMLAPVVCVLAVLATVDAAFISPDGRINLPKDFNLQSLLRDLTANHSDFLRDPALSVQKSGQNGLGGLEVYTTSIMPSIRSRKVLKRPLIAKEVTTRQHPVLIMLESLGSVMNHSLTATTTPPPRTKIEATLSAPHTLLASTTPPHHPRFKSSSSRTLLKKKKLTLNRIYPFVDSPLNRLTTAATTSTTTTTTTAWTTTTSTWASTTANDQDEDSAGLNQENQFLRFFSTPETPFFE